MHTTILNSKVSKNIRNQGETLFCWAFAISTMLRQSLNLLLREVDHENKKIVLSKLKSNDFHRQLRNELIMIPIPKILSSEYNVDSPLCQGHYLNMALERVINTSQRNFSKLEHLFCIFCYATMFGSGKFLSDLKIK